MTDNENLVEFHDTEFIHKIEIKLCENCEFPNRIDYNYCPECGHKTNDKLTIGVLFRNTISNYFFNFLYNHFLFFVYNSMSAN